MKFKPNYFSLMLLFILFAGGIALAQSPATGATAVSATTNFTFTATTAANEYLRVSTVNGLTSPVLNVNLGAAGATGYTFNTTDLTGALTGKTQLDNNTTYFWAITNDANGDVWKQGSFNFTTILGPPTVTAATSITSSGFTVNWTANATGGASDYILRVGSTTGGTDAENDVHVGNALSYTVSGIGSNVKYYYSVKASDGTNITASSNELTATTLIGAPTATAATSITSTGFTANWTANTNGGATAYIISIGTTSGGTDIKNNVNVGSALTYSITGLTASTNYYYSIKATDGTITTVASNEITATTASGLSAPTPGSASSVTSSSFTANWSAVSGAIKYYITVGTTLGGTDIRNNFDVGNVLTYTVLGLNQNTHYYYSIKAFDGTNTSNASSVVTVLTVSATGVPLTGPIDGLTGVSVLPTFTWNDIYDETTYTVKISTAGSSQAAFDAAVIATKITAQNATSYATLATDLGLPLANGTLYYWQVSIQGGSSNGAVSAINHFTTSQNFAINLTDPTGTVYTPTVDFIWTLNSPLNHLQFIVQYKYATAAPTDESFWSGTGFTQLAATPNMIVSGIPVLAGKTYYWRVLAQRAEAPNDYIYYRAATVCQTFSTAGGSTVTTAASWPTGGNTVYTNAPTLYWYLDQYVTGLTYEVDYVKDNGGVPTNTGLNNYFTDFNSSETHISTGSGNLYYVTGTLTPGTTYWWKVRAFDASTSQYSNWSVPASFVTAGVGTTVVPVPSYPLSGETVYTTSPTFYWYINSASSGLYYKVDISTDPSFGSSITGYPVTTSMDALSLSVTGLTPGKTYYWRVSSYNGTTQSAWSESIPITNAKFTVAGGSVASYPVASWPIGTTPVVYTPTPTLNWYLEGSALGITKYTVKWYQGSGAPPAGWASFNNGGNAANTSGGYADVSPVTTTSYTIPVDLTYGLTYYWAVAAWDGTSYSNWDGGSFSIVGGSAGASVVLSQPENGSTVYNTSQTLFWYINGSTYGISNYELQYSQSDNFTALAGDLTGLTHQYQAVSGLVTGATYYWRVAATYIDGTKYWSAPFSFTVNVGSPSIVQPIIGGPNNVQISTSTPMLSWALPAPTVSNTTYELSVATDANFTDVKTYSSTQSFMQLNGLNSGSSYYWKVKSLDGNGNSSNYSGTGKFSVGSITAVNKNESTLPTSYSVAQNYPNPFNPTTNIQYALPKASSVSIKIYNTLGQEVRTLISEAKAPGYYTVQWNGDNNFGKPVSSGIYIYRVMAGQYVKSMKMILLK